MANHNSRILIVDGNRTIHSTLEPHFRKEGFSTCLLSSAREAIDWIRRHNPEIVLMDTRLPDLDGLEMISRIRQQPASSIIILLSDSSDLEFAVNAVKAGADDCILKPVNPGHLLKRIRKILKHEEERSPRHPLNGSAKGNTRMVAESLSMRQILSTIHQIAPHGNSTILIRGETGVGKDLLARIVHERSPRARNSFVEINCPSFPPHLLENELFGHEKGAFTDARTHKQGLLEVAHKGTAFLNEIGDIDASVQAKLLQFLEKKIFRRIGSTRERSVDVRVIVATNQVLEQLVEENRFRRDLFYRLNVIPIYIPPLRERIEDIPALCEHFLHHYRREYNKPHLTIRRETIQLLQGYPFPGNVRELKNILERTVLLNTSGEISPSTLPPEVLEKCRTRAETHYFLGESLSPLVQQEKSLILKALVDAEWNQSKAARKLSITRDTLRYRMKKHQIYNPTN
jgi:two-component system response regulator AtoC